MSNTIYIDCNRANSQHTTATNNEWHYKLNTELLLPKGTSVQVQESFVNKKGINGGSIEIDEDIIEEITYTFYITENPHFLPVADGGADPHIPWFRSTLCCDTDTFRGNFDETLDPENEIDRIVKGYWLRTGQDPAVPPATQPTYYKTTATPASYNGVHKTPDFTSFGGCSQVLPQVRFVADIGADGGQRIEPIIRTLTFSIPKGVYGVGELSQLIQDQFNGVKYYDEVSNKIIEIDSTTRRRNDEESYNTAGAYDGQIFNKPFCDLTSSVGRSYSTSRDTPIENDEAFLCGADYNDLMVFLRDTAISTGDPLANHTFDLQWMKGNPVDDVARTADPTNKKIRPFYCLRTNYDDGTNNPRYLTNTDHVVDPNNTLSEYWLYQYDADYAFTKRLIGTTNFSIKYDTEKNGYSLNGLHNVMRASSHDRFGSKIISAGQPVINFKKCRRGAFQDHTWNSNPAKKASKMKVFGALNTPETRDMGIMILNWGSKTTAKYRTNKKDIKTPQCARFGDWFDTVQTRDEAWKKTIWYRLGFDYNQLNDVSTHTNLQYNKQVYTDYGFTTNVPLTNDIIPTTSTLSNPNEFKPELPDGHKPPANAVFDDGLQIYNVCSYAMPYSPFQPAGGGIIQGIYANSLFTECATYPTIIADVGGVVAKRLPNLTKHPYYLITSDICNNYKDNVKRGDVMPLLGVVAKTSLSNQDFISSQNRIVQVLSQDQVINKIHIKILNPDLTAPSLEENSSIIIKLDLPNKTPLSILEDDPQNKQEVQQIISQQNQLVGN